MPFSHRNGEIAEIAQWQGGHITTEQLYRLGLSRRAVQHQAAHGGLIRVYRGVYAVGALPTNPLDQAHGALLAAGSRTALAGWAANALWHRDRDWPDQLELISPLDIRVKGLIIHHSITLITRDIRKVQGLMVTSPARTALDLAPRVSEQRLERIVDEMRHENWLKVHQLRDVAHRNPRHPGTKPLLQLIGETQREPTRSELEGSFRRLIKRYALPTPLINVHVGGVRVDAYFPDHQLIVELDGKTTHADDWKPAFETDRARVVDVMAKTGIPTIRFTYDQTNRLHKQTAAQLRKILEARHNG